MSKMGKYYGMFLGHDFSLGDEEIAEALDEILDRLFALDGLKENTAEDDMPAKLSDLTINDLLGKMYNYGRQDVGHFSNHSNGACKAIKDELERRQHHAYEEGLENGRRDKREG